MGVRMLTPQQRREKIRSAAFTIGGRVYVEGEEGDHSSGLRDLERAQTRIQEVINDIKESEDGSV
jgi:hypothetical protein